MTVLYMLRCDLCDRTTPAHVSEEAMWRAAWADGWVTVAHLPEHLCVDCAKDHPDDKETQ